MTVILCKKLQGFSLLLNVLCLSGLFILFFEFYFEIMLKGISGNNDPFSRGFGKLEGHNA